jgi:drug/metabolite transporter (DMT)-like permease
MKIIFAFASVYLIWGSTYLAIRFAVETMPPFLMAGLRFVIAGAAMYLWLRLRGEARPTNLVHWRSAAIVGGLLLLGGNGGVVWAEQTVPSGLTALLIATVPMWMVLIDWVRPKGVRPTRSVVAGLILGFFGLIILIGPQDLAHGQVSLIGALVLVSASLLWAIGSIYSRHAPLPASPLLGTAMEMLAGGILLLVAGVLTGEWARWDWEHISFNSWVSFIYLILFGSLIGFTAYIWLLRVTTPARAGTYAFVNPVVAVFLGWALASEPITLQTLLAAAIIITGVAVIITRQGRSK